MSERGDEAARRRFWTEQMEAAYLFMLSVQAHPVEECGEPLAPLRDAADSAGVRVSFAAEPHVLGLPRLFFLREGLIAGFLEATREMNRRGWLMKVEDAFRTRLMQKHNALRPEVFPAVLRKAAWELGGAAPGVDLMRRRLAAVIAMSPRVGTHMCGSAIDISVLSLEDGREVDRGARYLEISELTPMESPFPGPEARANRREITALMARHGFVTYPFEFWHYNAGDAYQEHLAGSSRPGRYGPVDLDTATGRVTPIEDAARPLNSPEEIEERIRQVLGGGA
jgi:D-alanyl-D-alanine dipeptidase